MEINPPKTDRSTQELLEIVEMPEQWQTDIVTLSAKRIDKKRRPK